MKPPRADRDWAAIAVVTGVVDSLEIGRHVNAMAQLESVIRLQDFLVPIMERSVAQLEAQAACGEVGGMDPGNSIDDALQGDLVALSSPASYLTNQAQTCRPVDF